MIQWVDIPIGTRAPAKSAAGVKPYSLFIMNLLKQQVITPEMAETLHQLPNPPLQFQAMMRRRQQPRKDLREIVQEMLSVPPELPRAWQGRRNQRPRNRWLNRRQVLMASLFAGVGWVAYLSWQDAHRLGPDRHPAPVSTPSAPTPAIEALAPIPVQIPVPTHPHTSVHAHTLTPPLRGLRAGITQMAPAHLSVVWHSRGMVHVSWEASSPAGQYRLYSALSEDLREHPILQQDLIPMTWWDWMPPEGPATVWLAVSQVFPDGQESPLSRPVQIRIP